MGNMRRTVLAAGLALLILALLTLGWQFLGPLYSQAMVALARPLSAPSVTVQAQGMELVLDYAGRPTSEDLEVRIRSLTLQYGALFVTSLILVTPACAWRKRLFGVLSAWAIFSTAAIGATAVMSWGLAGTIEGGLITLDVVGPVMPLVYVGLPAVVAAIWCAKFWLPPLLAKAKANARES